MSQTYSISKLSKEFDVTARTIRFYEDKGLVEPKRRGSTRIYSERDRTRLLLTIRGKRIGLSLEECKEIIDMHDNESTDDAHQLLYLIRKICDHRNNLLGKINDLEVTLKEMNEVEKRCIEQLLNGATTPE